MNNFVKKRFEIVDIEKLKPYDKNPRHNTQSAKIVAKSIEKFGFINPIIVDEDYVILAGNTRYKALKLLRWTQVEVIVCLDMTEGQKKAFVIADNRVGEFSMWNQSALTRDISNQSSEFLEQIGMFSIEKTKERLERLIEGIEVDE